VLVQRLEHGAVGAGTRTSKAGADEDGNPFATVQGGDVGGRSGKDVVLGQLEGRQCAGGAFHAQVGLLQQDHVDVRQRTAMENKLQAVC